MPKLIHNRISYLKEFDLAPDSALFSQDTIAAVRQCSLATLERDRWLGEGIPFIKLGRLVRYRKADVLQWLDQHCLVHSTTQYQQQLQEGK